MEPLIPRNTSEAIQAAGHLGAEATAKTAYSGVAATLDAAGKAASATGGAPVAGNLGGQIAGGVWLTAIISAVLAQLEYRQKKNEIKELYKEELSAQLGKPVEKITTDDFDRLAATNHTFGEQLAKAKKERTVSIGVISIATLASVGAAFVLVGAVAPAAVAAGGITAWLATTAIAMMAYGIAKYPVQKLGEVLFNVDKKTTHERIEDIYKDHQAGKVISHERVFDVFVHANPPLSQYIRQQYGKNFDKLRPVDKLQITEELGDQLGVATLTDSINQGKIKSTELAFTVEGKFSGVAPKAGDKPKHTLVEKVSEKLHHAADKLIGHHPADDKPAGFSHAKRELDRRANPSAQPLR